MRRVAFLSYYFPPIGGAGSQRPARFVRHLRNSGYDPVVITGPGAAEGRWTPYDEALAAEIPADIEVHRLPGPEPPESTGRAARKERWLGVASPWSRWWVEGAVAAGRALGGVDLVYAWMSPFESAAAAASLAGRLDVPWVADLGDPWALDEMMVYPTRWHRSRELARMRRALASSDAVVLSTPEAVGRVRGAIPELDDKLVLAIPNGFDGADFRRPVEARRDGVFRIVHTGYLHTELGYRHRRHRLLRRALGGTVAGVDFLTRSHVFLLEAVDRLVQADPALASALEVHLAGVVSAVDREVAARSPCARMPGYRSHDRTLDLLRTADLLFLPMQDLPPGVRAGIIPGKTYEYLAANRPILAAVPDGDARDLLEEAGGAVLCRPSDVDAMTRAIVQQLARFRAGTPAPAPREDVVARYEYRRLAEKLAEVFDRLLERALAAA
jgi:glycosyltransferase involved in cell wall biosynthesis